MKMEICRNGDMEMKIWRYGNRDGDGEMEIWRWRFGDEDMDIEMEIWKLRLRYGAEAMEMDLWRWRYGDGYMDVVSYIGKVCLSTLHCQIHRNSVLIDGDGDRDVYMEI